MEGGAGTPVGTGGLCVLQAGAVHSTADPRSHNGTGPTPRAVCRNGLSGSCYFERALHPSADPKPIQPSHSGSPEEGNFGME